MATHIFPTIEEWSASKDRFRVVAYGFSRPFPLSCRMLGNTPLVDFHEANVEHKVKTILARNGISFYTFGLNRMPETNMPEYLIENLVHHNANLRTLCIYTRSEDSSNWIIAAEELSSIYADGGFGKDQIEVEIRNPYRMAWYASGVLEDDDDILAACQSVKSELLDQIRTYCGSAWSSVGFHLRTHVRPDPKPPKPTVLVYCHKGSRCDFDALKSALLKIISKANAGLRLEILPGSVISANRPPSIPNPIAHIFEQPYNGASIGLKGDTKRSGTLGGWFTLNLAGSLPSKVALTSHSLFSGIGGGSSQQKESVSARDKEESEIGIQVEYPAPSDLMATIKELDLGLKPDYAMRNNYRLRDPRGETLTDSRPIGHMIAASNYGLNENRHRMDWALIQVSNCITENKPPSPFSFTNQVRDAVLDSWYKRSVTPDSIITNLCEIIPGSWAVKSGKSTGVTTEFINRMPRIIQWDDQQESEELDFVGWVRNFAQAGDSGSFVIHKVGNLVGLLIATDPVTSCAFVTPIGEVLADVKAMTGGDLTIA